MCSALPCLSVTQTQNFTSEGEKQSLLVQFNTTVPNTFKVKMWDVVYWTMCFFFSFSVCVCGVGGCVGVCESIEKRDSVAAQLLATVIRY